MATNTNRSSCLISIQSNARKCGPDISSSLLSLHVFTGCDTISCFKGKGKIKSSGLMKETEESVQTFKVLGCNWHLTKDLFQQLEKFLCCVFGHRNVSSVNAARFNIFHSTGKFDNNLPPCQNSLWLHAERANYQAAIWRQCLHININAPSPTNYGWKREDQELVIH